MKFIITRNINIYIKIYIRPDDRNYLNRSGGSYFHLGPARGIFGKNIDNKNVSGIKKKKKLNE